MPTFLKVLVSLAIEGGCIIIGGAIGFYFGLLPMRDIPTQNVTSADGLHMALVWMWGLVIGTVVGICGIIFFWKRTNCAPVSASVPLIVAQNEDKSIWPPPPDLTV